MKVQEVETRFNTLTSAQQQSSEVIDARDGETSLKARLDRDIEKANKELDKIKKLEESTVSTVTTESDFTTVEATSNGYFEDVKLEGKTLVNLAKQPTNNGSINHQYATISTVTNIKPSTEYTYIIRNNGSETLKLYLNNNGGFDWFDLDVEANSTVIGKARTLPTIEGDIWLSLNKAETVAQNIKVVLLEGDHTQNPPSFFEGLKSVGDTTDEIVVSSVNDEKRIIQEKTFATKIELVFDRIYTNCTIYNPLDKPIKITSWDNEDHWVKDITIPAKSSLEVKLGNGITSINSIIASFDEGFTAKDFSLLETVVVVTHKQDKKRLLYYNEETQTWEKPILREWDSIEKHSDGKYYYHVRSKEGDYVEGDESLNDCITDLTVSVKKLAEEKVYECTNIDLITYANETNYVVESGAIVPKTTLKVHNNISNVVSLLQKKVSLLESNMTKYMITQNRMQLASTYSADSVTFKVDYFSLCGDEENYDEDLYNLILNNILVGKDNYDYDKMFTMILDYASWNQISWEQFDILVGLMDIQHNPPIEEIPTNDEIVEETPNEIM